ncbi:MAG TPA: glycerol kinase GlpK [Dehalococcoidia bacterium]|nr:glycerol kinase GlpK [Dehalococcoidia bacterium]
MADFVLALDQGTSSSRAILFDRGGAPVASAQEPFEQIYPQPGWVEHDPEEIWRTQIDTARQAMAQANASPGDVAAIGITNQRETTLIWDRGGRPIANAIVWQDRRTAGTCEELRGRGLEPLFRERTGLLLDPYFSGTKVKWLLDNVPDARRRAEHGELMFGTVDSWLIYRLTGAHATDYSNASRTLMYDIFERRWDSDLLEALDVPPSLLPEVRPSSGAFGETALLGGAIPVAGVAGDQQAALFGQACFSPGMAKNTYGTGAFLLMNIGERRVASQSLVSTIAWAMPAGRQGLPEGVTYALEGSIFIAGAAVQWLRDELGIIATAAESEELAASVPDSNGVYLVPAFVGLGAPHWDPHARGAIFGLSRGAGRAHITRAVLEAIALQSRDVIEAVEADSGVKLDELRVDGGAAANDLLLQIQADVLGRDVVRPAVTETTALGAAYLAGLATGFWKSAAEVAANWRMDRRFSPQMPAERREELYAGWKRAVDRALGWAKGG